MGRHSENDEIGSRTIISERVKTAGKSGKQIERCVIATFRIAEELLQRGTVACGRHSCGSVNDDLFQRIQRPSREGYRRDDFERLGFDPIAEIIWNLFRFPLGNEQHW